MSNRVRLWRNDPCIREGLVFYTREHGGKSMTILSSKPIYVNKEYSIYEAFDPPFHIRWCLYDEGHGAQDAWVDVRYGKGWL